MSTGSHVPFVLMLNVLVDPDIEGATVLTGLFPIVSVSVAVVANDPPFMELFVTVRVNVYVPAAIVFVLPLTAGVNGNPVAVGLTEIDAVTVGSSFV